MLESEITRLLEKYNITLENADGVQWLHAPHFDWHCAFIPKENYFSIAIRALEKVIKQC